MNATTNRNQTTVAESTKLVENFRAIARNPHKVEVNDISSIPLSLGFFESKMGQFIFRQMYAIKDMKKTDEVNYFI